MGRLLSRRSIVLMLVSLPLAAVILGIMACLPVPVGDPETSKVDPKFTGAWLDTGDGNSRPQLFIVAPYDSRTYLVRMLQYKDKDGNLEPVSAGLYKAWLTPLAGKTFVTLEPLPIATTLGWEKPAAFGADADARYIVGKLAAADDSLTLSVVDGKKAGDNVSTREKAEAFLKAHADDASTYVEKPLTFKKLDAEKAKPILEAFHAI